MKTKWCVLLGLFSLGIGCRVFATEADSVQTVGFRKYALQFHLDEKFRWSSFQGSLISFKVHFSPERAFRFAMSANYDYDRSDERSSTVRTTFNSFSLSMYPTWLFYRVSKPLQFYWGIGPILGFATTGNREEHRREGKDWQTTHKSSQTDWSFGAQAVAGTEFRIRNFAGAFLEYNPQLFFTYSKAESLSTGKTVSHGINLSSEAIRLGLAFYF